MKRVGFQGLAVILSGDSPQRARAPVVNDHGEEHNQEGGQTRLDFYMMKEQAFKGFVDDPNAGKQQQSGFDESRKIFYLAVAVLVIGVCWLV